MVSEKQTAASISSVEHPVLVGRVHPSKRGEFRATTSVDGAISQKVKQL